MATKHNNHRSWSSNVTYTGLTKIHSDTQPGTTARNTLANRRASYSLSTETNLHQKELRALDINKQALKNSMLAYTQKMRMLSARRLENTCVRKIQARAKTEFLRSREPTNTNFIISQEPHELLEKDKNHTEDDKNFRDILKCSSYSGMYHNAEIYSRLSIDSGIVVDCKTDNSEAMSDTDTQDFSDSCCSDSESIESSSYLSTKSESFIHSHLYGAVNNDGTAVSDSEAMPREEVHRRKKRYRRKWQIGRENPLLPTVKDDESGDDECNYTTSDDGVNSNFSIQTFPVDDSQKTDELPALTSSNVSNSIFYLESKTRNEAKLVPEGQKITLKPKPVQSPSVARIRLRQPRKKPKQESKPFQHCFRYSELFEETPEGLHFSDEGNIPHPTQLQHSNIEDLSMSTIKEMSPELETEDSISVSPLAEIDAFAKVQVISIRSEKILKSALKPKRMTESNRGKHVHFFLPDIFKR